MLVDVDSISDVVYLTRAMFVCSFIFELFSNSNLSFETKVTTCDVIDKLITFLTSEGWSNSFYNGLQHSAYNVFGTGG